MAQYILTVEMDDVRPLARLLRGISFQPKATVTVSQAGLALQVEHARTMTAVSYVASTVFKKYTFTPRRPTRPRTRRRNDDDDPFLSTNDHPTTPNKGKGRRHNNNNNSQQPVTPSRTPGRHRGMLAQRRGGGDSDDPQDDDDAGGENEEEDSDEELPTTYDFEVNLTSWLECLNIHGNATTAGSSGGVGIALEDEGGAAGGGGGGRYGGGGGRNRYGRGGDEDGEDGGEGGGGGAGGRGREMKLGGNTGMIMNWFGPGYQLELNLKDEDPKSPLTTCRLRLLEPEEALDDHFDQEAMVFHVIMKANWLKEALADLDPSSTRITIIAGPPLPEERRRLEEQRDAERGVNGNGNGVGGGGRSKNARERAGIFRLEAEGNFGKTELDYPNDRDVMDVFICSEPLQYTYDFRHFALSNRALQAAIKISIRIDDQGFLSLQLMMPTPPGKRLEGAENGIIEFKLRALEEETI